jgi:Txe/YoeB family toxin of Txe-Axe toxin-antitoxin module
MTYLNNQEVIEDVIKDIDRNGYKGIGKPEGSSLSRMGIVYMCI